MNVAWIRQISAWPRNFDCKCRINAAALDLVNWNNLSSVCSWYSGLSKWFQPLCNHSIFTKYSTYIWYFNYVDLHFNFSTPAAVLGVLRLVFDTEQMNCMPWWGRDTEPKSRIEEIDPSLLWITLVEASSVAFAIQEILGVGRPKNHSQI